MWFYNWIIYFKIDIMIFFKKKTREEKILKRAESVYVELTSNIECEFTDLETVQIINEVRRMLESSLNQKKKALFSMITTNNQNINEIDNALSYLE